VVGPRAPLPIGFNDLNPDRIRRAIEAGYEAGASAQL
jgi:hypothetical protein